MPALAAVCRALVQPKGQEKGNARLDDDATRARFTVPLRVRPPIVGSNRGRDAVNTDRSLRRGGMMPRLGPVMPLGARWARREFAPSVSGSWTNAARLRRT